MTYASYLVPFAAAFAISVLLTPEVIRIAKEHGIVDRPGGRRINKKIIPRLGGLAFVASFFVVSLYYVLTQPAAIVFWKEKIGGIDKHFLGFFLGALILVGAGIWDDIKKMTPWQKLLFQVLAALVVVGFGVAIGTISNPFGGYFNLRNLVIHTSIGEIFVWADLFAVIWIVGMINVVNWLDGLDGLAAGVSGIAALSLFFLSLTPIVNQPAVALISIILAGSVVGFLLFNFSPARIFMGDAGSMFLGYSLAVFAMISGGKITTAFLVLGFPILDGLWVILRRIYSGVSPWTSDRKHLHHRLLDLGLTQRQVVLILYLLTIVFGMAAYLSGSMGKLKALIWLFCLMLALAIWLVMIEYRKRKFKS